MSQPRAPIERKRRELGARFLSGRGIEIGALDCPLWVGPGASVTYVDRLTVEAVRRQYPELGGCELAPVDVVDDGEQLVTFADESLDFIIANHMLEHCENPLGSIRNHLRKLRPGRDFLRGAHAYLGGTFSVEWLEPSHIEVIAILRKRPAGTPFEPPPSPRAWLQGLLRLLRRTKARARRSAARLLGG